jgi:peptide/nickel transport system permease protein
MFRYVVRRLLLIIPILFGVTFITFIIISSSGDPLAGKELNPRIKPADLQNMRHNLGLDKPVQERYFIWLNSLAHGDLGVSISNGTPVLQRVMNVLPNTLLLSFLSITLALSIAIPFGILAAVKRNSIFDRVVTTLSVAGFAIPTVWLGLMLIILFSVQFRAWGLPTLPPGGVRDLRGDGGPWDRVLHLILPVLALTIPQLAGWVIYIRSSMLEVIQQDYVRTATSKGLGQRSVLIRHAFRNALLPLVTLVGLGIPDLLGGSLIVENVFAYPGMGRLTVNAVTEADYTVVMGTTLIFAILVILGNLLADVLYVVFDPRIRYS